MISFLWKESKNSLNGKHEERIKDRHACFLYGKLAVSSYEWEDDTYASIATNLKIHPHRTKPRSKWSKMVKTLDAFWRVTYFHAFRPILIVENGQNWSNSQNETVEMVKRRRKCFKMVNGKTSKNGKKKRQKASKIVYEPRKMVKKRQKYSKIVKKRQK